MFEKIVSFIKDIYKTHNGEIPLHAPVFAGNEKKYMIECVDSTFVSSIGKYVDRFEIMVREYTGAKHAVATVNGTAALHLALLLAGVSRDDEIITQAVTFVATANAISYCRAHPIFLDSDRVTLGLIPDALETFLQEQCVQEDDGFTYNKVTGRKISACIPMHVFGHPVRIDQIKSICANYNIVLVEDAAESIGSLFGEKHTGTFGKLGILSFNGNKIITTGGGGMILTDDDELGGKAKHLSTTAKSPHPWNYIHDYVGFNYRLPNINAALGCAQMEQLTGFIDNKRKLAAQYKDFFSSIGIPFITESEGCRSNYWLNAIILKNHEERDAFLEYSNTHGVMTRPIWTLIPRLKMYKYSQTDGLRNARWLEDRAVCIPSGVTT
jgi:perosamine synthetase